MAGSPTKKGNWGTWAVIDNPPPKAGGQCGGCIHYNEDGSCNVLPVIIHEVGRDYWRKCKEYTKKRPTSARANLQKRDQQTADKRVYVNCKYLSDENSMCTLWNSGWRRCTPDKCAYLDSQFRKKRSCTQCTQATTSHASILTCKKIQRAIQDTTACYCCFFSQRNPNAGNGSLELGHRKSLFSNQEMSILRHANDQGVFSGKKVLLTGQYSIFSREEALALLKSLEITMCIEPEDADIVVQATSGKKTYKLKTAQKLQKAGKSILFLSEKDFVAEFRRIIQKQP